MQIKKKLNKLNKLYIIFFSFVLFINIIFSTTLNANSFKISDLEISEPFELNFNKQKVIDKGFREAFFQLVSMTSMSVDKKKIINTPLPIIKGLIDSFKMRDEKFINNEYYATFDVNFDKKNTLNFFEEKNIFPSIPQEKNLLLIPVVVDLQENKIFLFNKNPFYEKWNKKNEKYSLIKYLLPSEDIEDVNLLMENSNSIENYSFKEMIKKYDLNDYIIIIIYKNNSNLRILSKLNINNSFKISNIKYKDLDIYNDENISLIFNDLKIQYEDHWKKINQINTSIKLPLTITIDATKIKKIENFESNLKKLDLLSNLQISKFDNNNIYYRITFNGSPNKFIQDLEEKEIFLIKENQIWKVR
jgi:hypothetical protein